MDLLASRAAGQDLIQNFLDPHTFYVYLHDRPVVWSPKLRRYLCVIAATKRFDRFRERRESRDSIPFGGESAHLVSRPMNWTENWLARVGMGRTWLGTALQHMETGPAKRRILQTIAGTYPGRALLHKWGRAESPKCPLCGAQAESQCHIQSLCPRLEGARTAAHHQVARCLWAEIERRQRGPRDDFTLVPETQVSDIRDIAPARCSSSWDQLWARFFDPTGAPLDPPLAELGRLRPDAVAVSWDKRRMYFLEVTRPYDSKADFAERSDSMKVSRYQAVIDRFKAMAPLWQAVVVPFTIGVRGSFVESAWTQHLVSLDLDRADLPRLFERVVTTALYALDTVYDARNSILRESPSLV